MLRATLKSLLSRKTRLVLSGLAVLLGVMFVAGALVLTDTMGRSFDALFSTVYANTDAEVAGRSAVPVEGSEQSAATVPASLLDKVRATSGVASATGHVNVDGARVIGSDGKVVNTLGAPRFGTNWTGTSDLIQLRQGRGPSTDDEIAINAGVAKSAGLKIGDRVGVLTLAPKQTFTLVGIFGFSGNRDSFSGEQWVAFTTPVAQKLMLGRTDVYSSISVTAVHGESQNRIRDAVATTVGGDYTVKTGKQLADEASTSFKKGISFFNYVLLGFAGVALFVGIFLILNTFSIIVAQRTRELALMRAVGASRRQMINSVLLEAVIIGVIASTLGLAAGIGVGYGLAAVFGRLTGSGSFSLGGLGVPASAIIASYAVGVLITLIAALMPALRAAKVAPVAAMSTVATADRPLTRLTLSGGAVLGSGAILLGVGLSGAGSATLWLILAGVLLSFIGVALLTPLIARPVVSLLGALLSWSVPGRLGRRNSARNPRRTAITAAALMVGIALITGVSTILSSATKSIEKLADSQVSIDLIISSGGDSFATYDQAVLPKIAAVPGVTQVVGAYSDRALVNGKQTSVDAVTDPREIASMFHLVRTQGTIDQVAPGQLVVDEQTAKDNHLSLGSTVRVQLTRGEPRTLTVSGIFAKSDVYRGWLVSTALTPDFRFNQPMQGFVTTAPGTVATVKSEVKALLADSPEVSVSDRSDFVKQQTSAFNTLLRMIQILLALAILIAVLGIVNTLALSVIERTRELGLLRAIGLSRAQAMRMITVEAVVISVFGALLGLVVGTGLGLAVVRALRDDGFTEIALPFAAMVQYLVLAAIVGVIAAVLPAIRAAKTNVLSAIAYE